MAQVKVRRFTLEAGNKNAQNQLILTLDSSNLGFNPVQGYTKAQIACNAYDDAGTFTVEFRPAGADADFFMPFTTQQDAGNAGEDTVIIGRDVDPLFDALRITFAGVAADDVEVYVGFIAG